MPMESKEWHPRMEMNSNDGAEEEEENFCDPAGFEALM